jgi:hypothetical protein
MLTIRAGDGAGARLLLSYCLDNTTPMRCERDQRESICRCGKAGSCSLGGWEMLVQKMLHSSRALINIKKSDYVQSQDEPGPKERGRCCHGLPASHQAPGRWRVADAGYAAGGKRTGTGHLPHKHTRVLCLLRPAAVSWSGRQVISVEPMLEETAAAHLVLGLGIWRTPSRIWTSGTLQRATPELWVQAGHCFLRWETARGPRSQCLLLPASS